MTIATSADPHVGQAVRTAGTPLERARAAVVMVHGRGATAESILTLAPELRTELVAYLAPQAAGGAWYPHGFMAPIAQNEPWLSSAMQALERTLAQVAAGGIPPERTVLLGFSQGACLATEYVARHARRYGGLVALSGGLIGPTGTPREYPGTLAGTPAFFGCSDVDGHIPATRVRESGEVLGRLGASVDVRLYLGMGHTVNQDEVDAARAILAAAVAAQ